MITGIAEGFSMLPEPLTVSALTEQIKMLFQKNFTYLAIKGEIANVTLQASGHLYFSIKDEYALLNGAFFHFRSKYAGPTLKTGDSVLVYGKLAIYGPRSNYQIIASSITSSGIGDLIRRFEETKKRLSALGYFDASHKKKLPHKAQTIGVVTSPTGAVIQDIIHVLKRRCRDFKLILYPVKVQGEGAAQEIAKAVQYFSKVAITDVVIVARGGGSMEDLQPFNEEVVVKAIYDCVIPVVSAVGHEVDYTLCDMVADTRAPTPSAAAEIVSSSSSSLEQWLESFQRYLISHAKHLLSSRRHALSHWERMLEHTDFYREACQRLDFLSSSLQQAALKHTQRSRIQLLSTSRLLSLPVHSKIHHNRSQLSLFRNSLSQHLSPASMESSKLRIQALQQQLDKAIYNKLSTLHDKRRQYSRNLLQCYTYQSNKMEELSRYIEKAFQTLHGSINHILKNNRQQLQSVQTRLQTSLIEKLTHYKSKKAICQESLKALNPKNILKRGYSILFDFNKDSAIISSKTLQPGLTVKAVFHDGERTLVVKE